ncbi:MAG: hypothetical protein HQ534_03000 [Armatimonadetes bacterium]|nr:hypothetical protein [Armatimonadota bacterium]
MNKNFIIGKIKKMFNENMIESFILKDNLKGSKYKMWWATLLEGTGLTEEGSKLFYKVVENILESPEIREIVTHEEVISYLQSTLTELIKIKKEDRLKFIIKEGNSIEKKLISLRKNVEVIFPILNLKLNRRSLQIGNVKIFNFTNYQLQKVLKSIKNLMVNNPYYKDNPNEIKNWTQKYKEILDEKFHNNVCAIIDFNKSPKRNYEDSIQKIQTALACLKLFSNHMHVRNNCQFGLEGTIVKMGALECLLKLKNGSSWKTDGGLIGYNNKFTIDHDFIKKANSKGLKILKSILVKNKKNEIEKRILNSIFWYAKSFDVSLAKYQKNKKDKNKEDQLNILSHEIGEKFLKLIICLESLLLFNEFKEDKKEYLKQRSSSLLLCTKKDKKRIQEIIDKSYNIRNDIVHQGYVNVTYSQLIDLDFLVKTMIINMIMNYKKWNISSNKDLYKWFEKKRLSAI